jgi:arylsulfatase A-like enzyme
MPTLSNEIRAQLKQADKLPYQPRRRDLNLRHRAPKRALMILVDGITPAALQRAHTPTFDALAAGGVAAADARTVFPTITGPAHTSILTGARVGTHGFLYPKMLDAYGNRMLDFPEGLMQAETIAEAWRPNGITSVGIGSRFLRGADALVSEGVVGEDMEDITNRAIAALYDWEPYFLMVVFYAADSLGHVLGPEAAETLAAIEDIDTLAARLLESYGAKGFLDETVVVVLADHGMLATPTVVDTDFVDRVGALPHGRLALVPHALSDQDYVSLLSDSRVDDIYGRDELEWHGAWGPRWGEQVILLSEGMMFPHTRKLAAYHGAWTRTEKHMPLIMSGAGIRAGGSLTTCETIDLAPTLSLLLGGETPRHSEGRILWETLDIDHAPDVSAYTRSIVERDALLSESKLLKKKYAQHLIDREEFVTRQTELKRHAEGHLAEIGKLRKELGIGHDQGHHV